MEPNLTTPPPVPLPPKVSSLHTGFKKSKLILVLAYIPIGVYLFSLLNYIGNSHYYMPSMPIFSLIPPFIVIFSKNKSAYKIGKTILIIEYLLVPIVILFIFIILSQTHW